MSGMRGTILRELGLAPLWRLRENPAPDEEQGIAPRPTARLARPAVPSAARDSASGRQEEAAPAASAEAAGRRRAPIAELGWDALDAEIRACTSCALHVKRNKAVPGIGDLQPDWLLVGEGPGAEEDRRGEPFVGPAGQLLDAMLAAVGLSRRRGAFIANAVKCRPPNNRTPELCEIATCFPYLERQIALLRPRLIVALGRPAAQSLLDQEVRISAVRGRQFSFAGIPLVVTYHPAYLLRNPHDKARAWEDLCLARRIAPPSHRPDAQPG